MGKVQRYSGEIEYCLDDDTTLLVSYSAYYDPGNPNGPIDNCYAPESDLTIDSITHGGKPYPYTIPEAYMADIEVCCWEDADSASWGRYDYPED